MTTATETASVHAVAGHFGAPPRCEYTCRETRLAVHAVREFSGGWNVIIDVDASDDGSRDVIHLNEVSARELARLLLDAADSENAEEGPAYDSRRDGAKTWFEREANLATAAGEMTVNLAREVDAIFHGPDHHNGTDIITAAQYEHAAQLIACKRNTCGGPNAAHDHVA